MLYRFRIAQAALTVVAVYFTVTVISTPTLEPLGAYIPVMAGASAEIETPSPSCIGCNMVETPPFTAHLFEYIFYTCKMHSKICSTMVL